VKWNAQIAEFIIEDTGAGISPEDQIRIFEPFERGAATASIPGTGLGLTITKLLTQILGGEITFSSLVGKGSRFRLRLMLPDRQEQSIPHLPAFPLSYEGVRKTILVVDDNRDHRKIMREILDRCGFMVAEAESGTDCLGRLDAVQPDMLLLDLSMPGMDGRELALRVRQGAWRHLPILFLTGNLVESANRHVPSLEGCPVLGKPVDLADVIQEIGNLLDLTWTTTDSSPSAPSSVNPPHETADAGGLPTHEKDLLLAILDSGDLRRMKEHLALLQTSAPHYATDISTLLELANSYRLEALRQHLEATSA
jgi:CheY-like chemotaxis protein